MGSLIVTSDGYHKDWNSCHLCHTKLCNTICKTSSYVKQPQLLVPYVITERGQFCFLFCQAPGKKYNHLGTIISIWFWSNSLTGQWLLQQEKKRALTVSLWSNVLVTKRLSLSEHGCQSKQTDKGIEIFFTFCLHSTCKAKSKSSQKLSWHIDS